jgi:hypothetical protein
LRIALSELSQTRRAALIRKPELNRGKRYVLASYLNVKKGKCFQTAVIVEQGKHHLGAPRQWQMGSLCTHHILRNPPGSTAVFQGFRNGLSGKPIK